MQKPWLQSTLKNELPRSRAARYQKEFLFNPDAEHRGIRLIKKIIIAGAFGSYINPESARIIGMLPEVDLSAVIFAGNTAGSGA